MASTSAERMPLLPARQAAAVAPSNKNSRNVTFNPQTSISHATGIAESAALQQPASNVPAQSQPRLAILNSKLRRRNSQGSPLVIPPSTTPAPKIGPQRTTKTTQKLKILPNPETGDDGPEEESGRDVYAQFTRIKDPTARRDAARLGKGDRERLPRVTAYCTASQYQFEGLMRLLKSKKAKLKGASPKQFDECIYTPYNDPRGHNNIFTSQNCHSSSKPPERRFSDSALEDNETVAQIRDTLDNNFNSDNSSSLDPYRGETSPHGRERDSKGDTSLTPTNDHNTGEESWTDFDTVVHTPEVFLFQYGTVVIWGMSPQQEASLLHDIARYEIEKLAPADIQVENFNFYYTREYQARIYNDFISLREKTHYMTKLAISHALAQSVKTSLFEELVSSTISATQSLPEQIALTGSINLSRREIHQQIGQLFILRINIHLQGSVLDSPELMWAEPSLEPVYSAVRSYLEMDQRVSLLTERLSVIADLLAVLKDQVGTKHGEYLEWIVIILIAAEILVAAINIIVDLYAGVD